MTIPALQRGLALLEAVAAAPAAMAFSDLLERVEAPRASLARLVATLREEGYLAKDPQTGRYRLGQRAERFAPPVDWRQRLTDAAGGVLAATAEQTRHSCMLVLFEQAAGRCVRHHLVEDGAAMLPVGHVQADLSRPAWGLIVYDGLDADGRRLARSLMAQAQRLDDHADAFRRDLQHHGYIFDDAALRSQRRFASALRHPGRGPVGAVALTAAPGALLDDHVAAVGRVVANAARRLEELLS